MSDFGNIFLVAFGIGLLIYIHELGHFLAARWIGVRVEVFSLGFGPRVWGFRRGATDYRLSLVPLGGYVAVAGMEPTDHRYPRHMSLHGKSVGQRFLFYSGGVVMNLLFALIAFPIAFGSGVGFLAPEIGEVHVGRAAWEARLEPGDKIRKVNGKSMYSFDNLAVEIALAGSSVVELEIQRGDEVFTVEAWPQYGGQRGLYELGIEPALADKRPRLSVPSDGVAARAGLRTDDELLEVNGVLASRGNSSQGIAALFDPTSSEPLVLRVLRDGEAREVTLQPEPIDGERTPRLGVMLFDRLVGGLRSGLPLLEQLGLRHGDEVLYVDGRPYRGPDLGVAANSDSPELTITVRRGEEIRTLRAPVNAELRGQLAEYVGLVADGETTCIEPTEGGAAKAQGILAGDEILSINGTAVDTWEDLRNTIIGSKAGSLQLEIRRLAEDPGVAPKRLTLTVIPQRPRLYDVGLMTTSERLRTEIRAEGFGDAVRLGCICSLDLVKQLYVTLKRLITGDVAAKNLGGIIQISRVSYHNVQWGLSRLIYFLALLSINLAFINVLPIPVLDGGHLAFLLIEKIKGSPVSTKVHTYSQILGLVFVLALVVFVTYNDILRLL